MPESATVITALKFQGGVILGADSQATDTVANVRWQVEKPVQVHSHPCVIGISGSMGMGSRVKDDILADSWHPNMFRKRDLVRDAIDRSFVKTYQRIAERGGQVPLWGLSVFWAEGAPHILEHETSRDCCFHEYFHAVGSGSQTAYAIFRTLGGRNLIRVSEQKGIQVTLRILRTCIAVEPFGVSEPVHLWVVTAQRAWALPDDQIQAELQYVDAWEQREREAFLSS